MGCRSKLITSRPIGYGRPLHEARDYLEFRWLSIPVLYARGLRFERRKETQMKIAYEYVTGIVEIEVDEETGEVI